MKLQSRIPPIQFTRPIPRLLPDPPPPPSLFADCLYLEKVIALLKRTRIQKNLGVETLAQRAFLESLIIFQAELDGVVPSSRELKAWTYALGLCWEQVWYDCLPSQLGLSLDLLPRHRPSRGSHRSRPA